jgi:hypothetical protein
MKDIFERVSDKIANTVQCKENWRSYSGCLHFVAPRFRGYIFFKAIKEMSFTHLAPRLERPRKEVIANNHKTECITAFPANLSRRCVECVKRSYLIIGTIR